uniref:Type II site-specific deoxyribonuclease n=1 Tax=Solibacter usitatus (strain Ellin6076) TaxID=234267 RepID=Q027X9_SOLUE
MDVKTISRNALWRLANALIPGHPINVDRLFAGSYNIRSVLEALLVHTPQFYSCMPGRIELIGSASPEIKRGHEHIVWRPDQPHELGTLARIETDVVISEVPNAEAVYDSLTIVEPDREMNIELQRRHSQIQVALTMIGQQLGFRTWIAQNDRGIIYGGQPISEMPGVIGELRDERLFSGFGEAAAAGVFIDVIWLRNHRFMPAVLEIEHSTGVTSGLSRMLAFRDLLPQIATRWVIVAPDEDRAKVIEEANLQQFREMKGFYFPYSAVEELYSFCDRRKLKGVKDDFLECFMEPCVTA